MPGPHHQRHRHAAANYEPHPLPVDTGRFQVARRRVEQPVRPTLEAPAGHVDAAVLVGEVEDRPAGTTGTDKDGQADSPENKAAAAQVHGFDHLQAVGRHAHDEHTDVRRPDVRQRQIEAARCAHEVRPEAHQGEIRRDHRRAQGGQPGFGDDPGDADEDQQSQNDEQTGNPQRCSHEPQPGCHDENATY